MASPAREAPLRPGSAVKRGEALGSASSVCLDVGRRSPPRNLERAAAAAVGSGITAL